MITLATHEELFHLPLLAGLDEATREQIARLAQRRTLAAGQLIVLEGEPCDEVYLVAHGIIRIRQMSLEGREHVLGYLGPGGSYDLAAVLDGGQARASTDALTEVVLYALPCRALRQILAQDARLAFAVAGQLASEVRHLTGMVRDLALHTVRVRLARFLLSQAAPASGTPAERHWTQEAIAAQIGSVRDVVGRVLRLLAEEGLIRRERGRIVVVDRARLEQEARGE